jgi:hypothetical protein
LPFPADWRDRLAPFDWKRIAVETVKVYEDALR